MPTPPSVVDEQAGTQLSEALAEQARDVHLRNADLLGDLRLGFVAEKPRPHDLRLRSGSWSSAAYRLRQFPAWRRRCWRATRSPSARSWRPASPPLATDPLGAFHLLGTDRLGRDVWARLVYGARVSLGVGTLAVLLSVADRHGGGGGRGILAGRIGTALLGLTDFALALPRVVLLLLLASLWQPSAALVILVLGLTGWMTIARLVYGEVRALGGAAFRRERGGTGRAGPRVLVRHILPNALTR